jgi:hypothetical protein
MFQGAADQLALADEAGDLHLAATVGVFQGIDFPDLLNALTPGF